MHRRVIHTAAAIHFKWHFDVLNQLVIDTKIKVIHITAPVTGGRNDAIRPTRISIVLLLIIQKVGVEFPHNVILIAEHEQARRCRVLLSVSTDSDSAQFQQELLFL